MSDQGTKGANDAGRAVPEVDDFGKVYWALGKPGTRRRPWRFELKEMQRVEAALADLKKR